MSKATSDRILVIGTAVQDEAKVGAAGTIQPGEIVEFDGSEELIVHGTADGTLSGAIIRERDLFGKDKTEVIPVGDNALVIYPQSGAVVQAFLEDTGNVAKGDPLVSDGLGALKAPAAPAAGTEPNIVYGFAEETLNNTTGSPARILVRRA